MRVSERGEKLRHSVCVWLQAISPAPASQMTRHFSNRSFLRPTSQRTVTLTFGEYGVENATPVPIGMDMPGMLCDAEEFNRCAWKESMLPGVSVEMFTPIAIA